MQDFMIQFRKLWLEVKGDKHRRNQHGKMRNTGSQFYRIPEHSSWHGRFIAQEADIRREFKPLRDSSTK
jgi:uncharacterized protein Usg